MDIVSKTFLEEINNKLNNHLSYKQWHSTSTVIEWFRAIENKKPVNSLSLTLQNSTCQYQQNYLKKFINFARSVIRIEDKIINILNMQENLD